MGPDLVFNDLFCGYAPSPQHLLNRNASSGIAYSLPMTPVRGQMDTCGTLGSFGARPLPCDDCNRYRRKGARTEKCGQRSKDRKLKNVACMECLTYAFSAPPAQAQHACCPRASFTFSTRVILESNTSLIENENEWESTA